LNRDASRQIKLSMKITHLAAASDN